ncbi:MAG: tripartite tricarboxylate transporter permease, partial [Betaproteobacteria bacterium]|nr:tripartite tricarboxylate transporter permease [Betaproteobacteria bacterium]
RMLQVPYKLLYPSALFFIAVGVFSTNNLLFDVGETLVFGVIGAVLMALDFQLAPVLLGYVLGPLVEEYFRRAVLLSRGDLMIFVQRPISAGFVALSALLLGTQLVIALRNALRARSAAKPAVR